MDQIAMSGNGKRAFGQPSRRLSRNWKAYTNAIGYSSFDCMLSDDRRVNPVFVETRSRRRLLSF